MNEDILRNRRVLLVEDEYVIAMDLRAELENAGAVVVGPVGHVDAAIEMVTSGADLDGAILDINLRGRMVYPVADLLVRRSVPVIFATGYDDIAIPRRFKSVPRCEKPCNVDSIREAMASALRTA